MLLIGFDRIAFRSETILEPNLNCSELREMSNMIALV
jgi:hypothetical protein